MIGSCETWNKALSRLLTWVRVTGNRGERFATDRIMFLAGEDGGDVGCLKALGVSAEQMLAVDFNAVRLAKFQERHPDVETFHGVSSAVEGIYDVVFLDLTCTVANRQLAVWLQHGVRSLSRREGSVFVFALSYGHDAPAMPSILARASTLKGRVRQQARTQLHDLGYSQDEMEESFRGETPTDVFAGGLASDRVLGVAGRLQLAFDSTWQARLERRLGLYQSFAWTYFGNGTPMAVMGTVAKKFPMSWTDEKFTRRQSRYEVACDVDDALGWRLPKLPSVDPYWLLSFIDGIGLHDQAAEILGVSSRTVGAYRANAKRAA